jgi:Tol biopolymer transport system component
MRSRPLHAACFSRAQTALRCGFAELLAVIALLVTATASSAQTVPAPRLTADSAQQLSPTVAPDGGVAYSGLTAPGNWDIYVARDGRPPVNLTADSPTADVQPSFSPDGRSIAFRSERQGGGIFVMAAGGGAPRRVLAGAGWNPSWSPDGTKILYNRPDMGSNPYGIDGSADGIWIADAQTGETSRVREAYAFEPRMSPNGQRIAYWALGVPETGGIQRDIWTVRADGTEARKVTDDEATDWNPVWSPDGRQLYFASDRDGAMKVWRVAIDPVTGLTTGSPELVTKDAGAQVRGGLSISADGMLTYADRNDHRYFFRATVDAAGVPGTAALISDPTVSPATVVVSPDGAWVAFNIAGAREDLFVMRSDGTGLRRLTDDVYRDRVPTWAPDSRHVTFRSDRPAGANAERTYRWWTIEVDGSNLQGLFATGASYLTWSPVGIRAALSSSVIIYLVNPGAGPRLLGQGGTFTIPVWSADGNSLAYRDTRGQQTTLFAVDATSSSAPVAVVTSPTPIGPPILSPDGRRIAYLVPNDGVYVADATQAGSTPEKLPAQPFNPLAWSADGKLLLGTRTSGPNQLPAPMLYNFETKAFELLAESGAGSQWSADGARVLVSNDGGTKLQLIDRATKTVRQVTVIKPPVGFSSVTLAPDGRTVSYSVGEVRAHIYRVRVP